MSVTIGWKPAEHMLVLPRATEKESRNRATLRHLVETLGGREAWGYEEISNRFACVKPSLVVEEVLPRALTALNELMALTPVTQLPGMSDDTVLLDAPPADERFVWDEDTRRRVRLLSGL